MHRTAVLLALAACEPGEGLALGPPAAWVYAAVPGALPLGELHGRLGRSQPPQPAVGLTIRSAGADRLVPLRRASMVAVPGAGPARAVVHGSEGEHVAIELVDVDAGRVIWRDQMLCAAPLVTVTGEAIVCGDGDGLRAIGLDGAPRWTRAGRAICAGDGRIVTGSAGTAVVLDAASGDELARIALPRGVPAESIVASCGAAGRELLAQDRDGRLVRIADAPGGPAVSWSVGLGGPGAVRLVDACSSAAIVVEQAHDPEAGAAVIAIARTTGAVTGRVDGVQGVWPARDGTDRLEVASALGVASYPRDLAGAPLPIAGLPALGPVLAARGDRRLVRATPLTAVLLDRAGVRGYLPLAHRDAVLGDGAVLAARATSSPSETVRRLALPAPGPRGLRLSPRRPGLAGDAELRDLPPVLPLAAAGFALPDTGMYSVGAPAIDPGDPAALYAVAVDLPGERAAVARADLAGRRWRWQRGDGCGPGTPVGLAIASDAVVCAATGTPGLTRATVRATSRDGAARWQWTTDALDGIAAGGDVALVHDADRVTVLDVRDGAVIGQIASDDGARLRTAIVVLDAPGEVATTLVISGERGRVIARLATGGMLPVWSIAVAGTVRALAPAGDGVLVALEDGDAYRIDARSGSITAFAGLGLGWQATAELVIGDTRGGAIPAPAGVAPAAAAPTRRTPRARRALPAGSDDSHPPPAMATPVALPPALGASWQLTLYELTGGLRARNDYALDPPVAAPAIRAAAGSPLVVAHGAGLREVVVLDPRTGDPLRRIRLPDEVPAGTLFGTVVDGSPVAGAVLASPLRVVVF